MKAIDAYVAAFIAGGAAYSDGAEGGGWDWERLGKRAVKEARDVIALVCASHGHDWADGFCDRCGRTRPKPRAKRAPKEAP